jgi:hypothetical protein
MDRAKMSLANVSDPKAIVDSLNLVLTRFYKCMEGVGIKQLEAIGQPFDPRNHEPVQEVETNEFPDGVVMHELRKGYIFKDKVLRPSLVNVSSNASGVVVPKAPPPPPPPVVEENSKPEEVAAPPIPLPASEVAHTQANSTAADSQTSAAPSNGSDQAAVVAPESEDKPAVAVDAQPHDKVRSENVLEAAAREAKKTNETGDLLKKFTGTATGELPIFQMDEDSLTMPVQDLNLSTPELQLEPKKKKLDESLFDLSDKKENE